MLSSKGYHERNIFVSSHRDVLCKLLNNRLYIFLIRQPFVLFLYIPLRYQDCILITKHENQVCTLTVTYDHIRRSVLLCLIFVTGNTSFQKQESSVHFPLQINKFVIVRFTLVLSLSLSLSLSHLVSFWFNSV